MSGASAKFAKVLIAAVTAMAPIAAADAVPNPVRYTCPASADLTVERNGSSAHVNFAGRTYYLRRARSSIGDKYLSGKAALIIDGASAVFVAEDHLDLGTCTQAVPIASAQ